MVIRLISSFLPAACALVAFAFGAQAAPLVVASIKPVHSLVAGVMEGVGEPVLLVRGAASPHDYALKPSQAAQLQKADAIFWIGHRLEAFLEKPVETVGGKARSVELAGVEGLVKLDLREGGAFDKHGHEHEDAHGERGHEEEHEHEHEDEHAGGHGHEDFDMHLWLDPENARIMIAEIRRTLAKIDPANAARYAANAEKMTAKLEVLNNEVRILLEPLHGKSFIVFHDAYRYFENRFAIAAAGSITVSPEVAPGVERIREIRSKIESLDAVCVFTEPQFPANIVAVVTEGTRAGTAVLDPLGAALDDGPDLYFRLIGEMAKSIRDCLS